MTPRDWTLLVIAAAEKGSLQPVQLQKALFLIGKRLNLRQLATQKFYTFDAYDYGPFTNEIYNDAEQLETAGLVVIARPPATRFKEYHATDEGLRYAAGLRAKLEPAVADYVSRIVKFTRSMSFNDLVSAVYKAYPEMRENSVFKDPV